MDRRRRIALGLDVVHAEAAISAFVNRIIGDDPAADATRNRLYSVGLTPNFVYSLKKKRQRALGAAKLVAALVACDDLEVVVIGEATEGSPAPRWIVRAEAVRSPSTELSEPNGSTPIQLSLFSHLESSESVEIEMRDVQFTRKDSHRAEIRVDFVLKQRKAS